MKTTRRGRTGARMLATLALPAVLMVACEDDPTNLPTPELVVEPSLGAEFAETDPLIGTDEVIVVEATNAGGGEITISEVAIEGAEAGAFSLSGTAPFSLAAGETAAFEVGFAPATEGRKNAVLVLTSDDPRKARVEIAIRGQAARFRYTQVDRKGIPALNTVFNHPSGTAGFDKRAYNVASPAGDVATYRDQFITVLGAVGNADPQRTADLLLPDELPVSLAASPTAFAQLTGRALADDATDVALLVTVGDASLHSDHVDTNDKTFLSTFPYVATPH